MFIQIIADSTLNQNDVLTLRFWVKNDRKLHKNQKQSTLDIASYMGRKIHQLSRDIRQAISVIVIRAYVTDTNLPHSPTFSFSYSGELPSVT